MKAIDTATVACLFLVIPYCTKCDSGGKIPEKTVSHETVKGSNVTGHGTSEKISSAQINTTASSGNVTVNTSKSPEILSSREGVKVLSTQSVTVTSSLPPVHHPVVIHQPEVTSEGNVGLTNKNGSAGSGSDMKNVHWTEGGAVPAHKSKETKSSEQPKSSSQESGNIMYINM